MRKLLLSFALGLALLSPASAQNYSATAGAGLTFGANLVGGVLYPQQNMCDPTTPSRCVAVDASGRITALSVQSGTWTVQPGNTANTTPWLVTVDNTLAAVGNNVDDVAAGAGAASPVVNYGYLFDGTNWDRQRSAGGTGFAGVNPGTAANWALGATGAAVPANAQYLGFNSGGNLTAPSSSAPLPVRLGDGTRSGIVDPCEATLQTSTPISITTATTTRIVTPSASNKTYICGLVLVTAAANNVAIVEGTGGTCGTGTAGVIGGTTAANGANFSANGGLALQAGKVSHAYTAGTNVDLCLITSAATPLAGVIKYVQAP